MTMSDAYVIETGDEVAGVVLRIDQGFRFYAVTSTFSELERQLFTSPGKAERSAMLLARSKRRKPPRPGA